MTVKLERPLIFFDIESTGTNPARDRIITLAWTKMLSIDTFLSFGDANGQITVNPGLPIPPETTAVHGITDEQVKDCPLFSAVAAEQFEVFKGCDLAGYNLANFDIPLLWEEFYRCDMNWDLTGIHVIDAGNIFKKKEERTLAAAVQFYCGRAHDSAHDAQGDVQATMDVLAGQLRKYPDIEKLLSQGVVELALFSRFDDRVDLAGKIVRNPAGEPVYNFGKSKGVRVVDDPGFARWMLGKDFSENTKLHLLAILEEYNLEERLPWTFVQKNAKQLPFE